MNISTIQKRRFLENIYKLYYSNGTKPTEQQILNAFSDYFSVNKAGFPLPIDYAALNGTDKTNVDILNELMINSLFNLDVLYDTILENNDELFKVATTLAFYSFVASLVLIVHAFVPGLFPTTGSSIFKKIQKILVDRGTL